MWNGINRRKFPRIHYSCLIHIKKMDGGKVISTETENIGEGGICVVLNEDLGLFQGVSLEIDLKNGSSGDLKCNGTVVWVVKKRDTKDKRAMQYDTGIEFVDIADESKMQITEIIDNELTK